MGRRNKVIQDKRRVKRILQSWLMTASVKGRVIRLLSALYKIFVGFQHAIEDFIQVLRTHQFSGFIPIGEDIQPDIIRAAHLQYPINEVFQ